MNRYGIDAKPGSRKGPLVEPGADGRLTVHVRSRVTIVRGHTSCTKVVDVDEH